MRQFKGTLKSNGDYFGSEVGFLITLNGEDLKKVESYKKIIAENPEMYEINSFFYGIDILTDDVDTRLDFGLLTVSSYQVKVEVVLEYLDISFDTGNLFDKEEVEEVTANG